MNDASAAQCGLCASRFGDDASGEAGAAQSMLVNVVADVSTTAPDTEDGRAPGIDRVIALWRSADLDIAPIVGRRGALAVLRRALALNQSAFDWLPALGDVEDLEDVIARLREAFTPRQPHEADVAADALSATFGDLLSLLVGPALAAQLCGHSAPAGTTWRLNPRSWSASAVAARSGAAPPLRRHAHARRPQRGGDLQHDLRIAEKNRMLFLLDARIAAAREELTRLHDLGAQGERRAVNRHEARLVHANERLVLSAIDAGAAAVAAASAGQRDLLTGLPNRGLTLDRLDSALASARRNVRKLGVLFVDLDAFKAINDTLGHPAGDRALQVAACRLAASVRDSDTVGRFGGDEFLAILPDLEASGDASVVAAKMVAALSIPIDDANGGPPLTASIGVAIYPEDAATAADLIAFADDAMYRAKARGSGQIEGRTSALAAPHAARPSDLRDANEHLVLAVLGAQGLQGQAEEIHQRQVMFLSMVAHELRNPLNPIRAAADLLQHAPTSDGLLARVQVILRRQVTHLTRLVDDLLDGARASTGKFRLECGTVSLRDILDPVIAAIHPAMAERRQTLALQLPTAALTVHADAIRLTQVFTNLLDNASKYSAPGGEIAIELSSDGQVATLCVTDKGIGITAEALPRIFDLFVQEIHARAHNGQGLGIGLAIVRELVESHGGTIHAFSAGRGLGSRFVVTLPVLSPTLAA